jgi:protein-disulfide isomerase
MNKRLWVVFGIIIIAVIGLAVYAVSTNKETSYEITADDVTWNQIINHDTAPIGILDDQYSKIADNVYGKTDSKVVFLQWMNFQCSACQSLFHTVDDIYQEYSDRVAFVDRYLYLVGHPNGLAASVAAEAAARQGKYYEMHQALFSNAEKWNSATIDNRESIFRGFAESAGLDIDQWANDYKNYETNGIKQRLDFQNKLGLDGGITGTPYMTVNGQKVDNNKDAVTSALNQALEEI